MYTSKYIYFDCDYTETNTVNFVWISTDLNNFVKKWSDLGNKQSGIVISLFIERVYTLYFFLHFLVDVIPRSDNL